MAQKVVQKVVDRIPPVEVLEERFSFIDDAILRSNLAITLRYVVFLTSIDAEIPLPGPLTFSLYKDIIVYTASIVESCLNYTINQMILRGKIKKQNLPYKWSDDKCIDIHSLTKSRKICGVIRHKKYDKIDSRTQFQTINEIAFKSKLINQKVFVELDKLREIRNHIHLASLDKPDEFYDKHDINQTFQTTKSILSSIEKKLNAIRR